MTHEATPPRGEKAPFADASAVPDGYRRDGHGRLIPESLIRSIDLQRDQLVIQLVEGGKKTRDALKAFREHSFAGIAAHVELSMEQHGVKRWPQGQCHAAFL